MTILEAYKKLESELGTRPSFLVTLNIARYGERAGAKARCRIQYTVTIEITGEIVRREGDDLSAVVAMALHDWKPVDATEKQMADASDQAAKAAEVLK